MCRSTVPHRRCKPHLSGTTDIASVSIAGLISHIRSGTLKALAQTGAEHWVDMPDVPTMQEAGIPNAVVETSQMFLAPAGTPPEVIKRLSEETRLILQKPEVKDKMLTAGFMVKYEGPERTACAHGARSADVEGNRRAGRPRER